MATTYRNPSNGYAESVSGLSVLWAMLFGMFWWMVKGLWPHALIQFVLALALIGTMGPAGIMLVWIVQFAYAFAAPSALGKAYLRKGWRIDGGS